MTQETATTGMPGHFAKVANVYRELRTTDPEPILYIRDALAGRASVRAADVGCGAGRYDRLLFEHIPNLHLICVDASAQMLEQLSGYLDEAHIQNFVTQLSRARTWRSRTGLWTLSSPSMRCITSTCGFS